MHSSSSNEPCVPSPAAASRERRAALLRGTSTARPSERPPLSLEALLTGEEAAGGWERDPAPGPDRRLVAREAEVRLWICLLRLEERERLVMLLRYWA